MGLQDFAALKTNLELQNVPSNWNTFPTKSY